MLGCLTQVLVASDKMLTYVHKDAANKEHKITVPWDTVSAYKKYADMGADTEVKDSIIEQIDDKEQFDNLNNFFLLNGVLPLSKRFKTLPELKSVTDFFNVSHDGAKPGLVHTILQTCAQNYVSTYEYTFSKFVRTWIWKSFTPWYAWHAVVPLVQNELRQLNAAAYNIFGIYVAAAIIKKQFYESKMVLYINSWFFNKNFSLKNIVLAQSLREDDSYNNLWRICRCEHEKNMRNNLMCVQSSYCTLLNEKKVRYANSSIDHACAQDAKLHQVKHIFNEDSGKDIITLFCGGKWGEWESNNSAVLRNYIVQHLCTAAINDQIDISLQYHEPTGECLKQFAQYGQLTRDDTGFQTESAVPYIGKILSIWVNCAKSNIVKNKIIIRYYEYAELRGNHTFLQSIPTTDAFLGTNLVSWDIRNMMHGARRYHKDGKTYVFTLPSEK